MSSLAVKTPEPALATAVRPIIYLGMDVHKESITIAVLPVSAKAPTRVERLVNELPSGRVTWALSGARTRVGTDSGSARARRRGTVTAGTCSCRRRGVIGIARRSAWI